MLSMQKGFELLKKYGVPIAKQAFVKKEEDAVAAAKKLKYPVAIKIDSRKIVHKTEKKAVAICKNEKELRKQFKRLAKLDKKAQIIIQQKSEGVEVIVGGKRDPQFGSVVVFGLGGVFVEVMKDVSLRVTPITPRDADEMIKEIKGYPLLAGARGKKAVNFNALRKAILAVAKLMHEHKEIKELDVNPLFANEKGVTAVDVRVI